MRIVPWQSGCCQSMPMAEKPLPKLACDNTKGYSSTDLAMGLANVRAGTQKRRAVFEYPPEH